MIDPPWKADFDEAFAHADLAFRAAERAHRKAASCPSAAAEPAAGGVSTIRLVAPNFWSRLRLAWKLILAGNVTIKMTERNSRAS